MALTGSPDGDRLIGSGQPNADLTTASAPDQSVTSMPPD